jgi:hypothetical protein
LGLGVGYALATVLNAKILVIDENERLRDTYSPLAMTENQKKIFLQTKAFVRLPEDGVIDCPIRYFVGTSNGESHTHYDAFVRVYCKCRLQWIAEENNPMIECGNKACPKGEWFHKDCLELGNKEWMAASKKNVWYCCVECEPNLLPPAASGGGSSNSKRKRGSK